MHELIRHYLEQTGGRCPFPDTDPDVWIAPDGRVGRVVVLQEPDVATETALEWEFIPLVLH